MRTLSSSVMYRFEYRHPFPDIALIYKFERLEKRNQQVIEYVSRGTRKLTSLWVK